MDLIFETLNSAIERSMLELRKEEERIILEGLARKGYYSEDKKIREDFIRENCSIMRSQTSNTYCVYGVPFLIIEFGDKEIIHGPEHSIHCSMKVNYKFL